MGDNVSVNSLVPTVSFRVSFRVSFLTTSRVADRSCTPFFLVTIFLPEVVPIILVGGFLVVVALLLLAMDESSSSVLPFFLVVGVLDLYEPTAANTVKIAAAKPVATKGPEPEPNPATGPVVDDE